MLFRRFIFLLFVLFFSINFLCLFIAVVSPLVNPKYFWPPAVFGLFFKVFFGLHCLFLLGFLLLQRNRKVLILGAFGLIICIPSVFANYAFHFQKKEYNSAQTLRLMTYNCTSFGWFKNPDYDAVLNNIRTVRPDILCLQEYYKHHSKHKRILKFMKEEMGFKYYYEYTTKILSSKNQVGQAYFSRIPLHNFTPIPFQEKASNGASFVDIYLPEDTIRLVNVHFQSIRLHEDEYTLPDINTVEGKGPAYSQKMVKSLEKLRNAYRKRSYQVNLVDSVIENSPYKIVLCGDCNDTPNSYLYHMLTGGLDDTYLKTNSGIGSTFAGKIPALRIDYVLADPEIDVAKTFVLKHTGGQHYPLISDFNLKKP